MTKEKILIIIDKIIEIGILAIVFLTPIIFAFFQETFNVFELYKQVFFRSVLLLILSVYIGKILLVGKIKSLVDYKVFVLLFLAGLAFFISSFFSIHPEISFWGSYDRMQGFYTLSSYLLFFLLLILNLKDWRQIKRIIIAISLSSVFVCIYGLLQYFSLDMQEWKEKVSNTGRIFSSLGQPNLLGHFLVITFPLIIFSGFVVFKRSISRFFIFILILAQLFCILFTYSRAAWLSLLASLSVFIIFYLFFKKYKKLAWSLIGLGIITVSSFFIFNFYSNQNYVLRPNNLVNRFISSFDLSSGSNKIRFYYWQASLKEFKEASVARKLFGYGPDVLDDVFVKDYRPEWGIYEAINSFPDRAHNLFLDLILQFGLFGFLIILFLYSYIIILSLKYLKQAETDKKYLLVVTLLISLVGYFINNLFSFSLSVSYIYLFIVFGLLLFLVSEKNTEKEIRLDWLSTFSRILIFILFFTVSLLFIFLQNINYLRADYYYMKAKNSEIIGDCPAVLDNLEKMVNFSFLSFYKERYIFHSLNCFNAVSSREARVRMHDNIIEMANLIGPREYRFYTWLNIAHTKSLLGFYINNSYYKGAEADYERLLKINPYITTIYKDLGRMQLWQGDYDNAVVNFNKAIEVMPSLNSPHLNNDHKKKIEAELISVYEMVGFVYFSQKNYENSLEYYKKVLKIDPYHLRVYKKIADSYYEQGDLDMAIWYNKRGYMLNKNDYSWPFALALLYEEKKDKENSRKYAQEALDLDPMNKQIKLLLE